PTWSRSANEPLRRGSEPFATHGRRPGRSAGRRDRTAVAADLARDIRARDGLVYRLGDAPGRTRADLSMNPLDLLVLFGSMAAIAAFGAWKTRGRQELNYYLKGDSRTGWAAIGVSVMATQASAVTFLSMPGQGYQDGLGFVQNYFGAPFA